MNIAMINYPFIFTSCGKRLNINEVSGDKKEGSIIELVDGKYKVTGFNPVGGGC